METCCFLFHYFCTSLSSTSKFYPLRARAPLMPLFSNPQFSGLNNARSRDLELEWGNCTGTGGTRQNKSLWTNPQSDSQGPLGSSESWREIRESFGRVSPCISACVAGRGRLRGQTEGPGAAPLPVCGGARRDRVSLLPHFKLTLRLWPALNTADNAGFIARGWWQTGTNCQAATGSRGIGWSWGSGWDAF